MKLIDETKLAAIWDKAKSDSMALLQDIPVPPVAPVVVQTNNDYTTLTAGEKLMTYAYIAASAVKNSDGSVASIPEMISGKYPLKYAGLPNPTITGIPPTMFDASTLEFLNRPNTKYETASFPVIKTPYTVVLVGRKAFGQTYEALLPGGPGACNYIGFGGGVMRVMNAGNNVPGSVIVDDYKMTVWQINVNTNGTADYYAEGVKVNTVPYNAADIGKVLNGVGVLTNNSDWHFAAMYVYAGILSASSYATFYKSIATRFNVGSYLNEIILSRITWNRHGDVGASGTYWDVTPTIKSVPVGMTPADPAKWNYNWYYMINNFTTQVGFGPNSPRITMADFPAISGVFNLGCRVTPVDSTGRAGIKHNGVSGAYTNTDQW